jgi:hypothetical protein
MPGLVLNIGSGICAGLYHPDVGLPDDESTLAACCAVGRWLYIDPRTQEMTVELQNRSLHEHVSRDQLDVDYRHRLRMSPFLSTRGIALRFLGRLSDPRQFIRDQKIEWDEAEVDGLASSQFDPKFRTGFESFCKLCNRMGESPEKFPLHKLILCINAEAEGVNATLRQTAR